MQQNLLLSTPTNPKVLETIFNENKEFISKITLVSIDFPPIEIFENINLGENQRSNQTIFNKKENQAVMFDVVGLIIDISLKNSENINESLDNTQFEQNKPRKIFLLAQEVMFIKEANKKLISINGNFDVLPEELIANVYVNFSKLKSIDLAELEGYLELSRDETAIKAFYKLGSFFTAKKYEINNNVFNLIKHQEEAEIVAKKVILKKMVAWEIRK